MGHIICKTDKNGNRVELGFCGPLKKHGKMIRFLLEWWRDEKWGKHQKIDVPYHRGVFVVGVDDIPDKPKNNSSAASVRARKWKAAMRMIRKTRV